MSQQIRTRSASDPKCLAVAAAAAAAIVVASCGGGGGGGGPPARIAPRFELNSPTVPAGATASALKLALVEPRDMPVPVLVQMDLVTDPTRLTFRGTVEAQRAIDRIAARVVQPGRLRIVFGDTTHKFPSVLPTGELLRIPVDVVAGTAAGGIEVKLEGIVASAADGASVTVDGAPVTGTVTLQ